jgi:hypothetical protein
MPPRSGNDRVLSYGDVLLRKSDVELLEGPHWLNDQVKEEERERFVERRRIRLWHWKQKDARKRFASGDADAPRPPLTLSTHPTQTNTT